MKLTRYVAKIGDMRNGYKVFIQKSERTRPLGRPRCWWQDNIKMHLKAVQCVGKDCIHLAQGSNQWWACVNMVTNLQLPQGVGNFLNR
jgi:hypothetical protein